MSITNLFNFVDMLIKKLQEKEVVEGVQVEKFEGIIRKLLGVSADD